MKTIKIIDLLVKANNGEIIKKIKYNYIEYEYNKLEQDWVSVKRYNGLLDLLTMTYQLNDEVEIVEEKGPEEKQIKKLDWFDTNGVGDEDDAYYLRVNGKEHYIDSEYDSYGMTLILKINELIDAVNESRKENK